MKINWNLVKLYGILALYLLGMTMALSGMFINQINFLINYFGKNQFIIQGFCFGAAGVFLYSRYNRIKHKNSNNKLD